MAFRVSGKNIDVGDALRARISERIDELLTRYFDRGYSGHATVGKEGFGFRTECAVHLDSGVVLQAEGLAADAYSSADQAALRIEKRLRRYRGRLKSHPRADEPRQPPAVDALCTDVPGRPLGVLVADCAPVLIADPRARVIGAAHAGREGMAAGVVPALVRAMTGAGADPAQLRAVIGPAICGGCYEVPAQLRARIAAAVPEAGCVTRRGSPGIDVRAGVGAQLAAAGVLAVSRDPRCTAETPALYSYRRDGRTGRFAGLVWLA